MKNIVHEDCRKFWLYREKLLAIKNCNKWGVLKFCYEQRMYSIQRKYNAVIPLEATIQGVPSLPHGLMNIFLSKQAVIGENCTIFQNVTIGSVQTADSVHIGAPKIGDNVLVGANAVLIGKITVGDGAKIGAGTAVALDVPAGATVVSQHPLIIQK